MQLAKHPLWRAGGMVFSVLTISLASLSAFAAAIDPSVLTNLVFDAVAKTYEAKLNEPTAPYVFSLTNTWTNELTVDRVQTSCGCTVASLPANPWHIPPGGHGEVKATLNLEGKGSGLIHKTITFYISSKTEFIGTKVITVNANVPNPPAPTALTPDERKMAMEQAKGDPQQIFTNPKCAECHVNRGQDQHGAALYAADCGICHDSPNRASSVPDLHHLKVATTPEYWKSIVTFGKPHTMMPGFSKLRGGPLDNDQVHSVIEYVSREFKGHPDGVEHSP